MSDEKKTLGCIMAALYLLLCMPLWYVLLFWVLWHNDAPAAIWACYWVYTPVGAVLGIIKGFFDQTD